MLRTILFPAILAIIVGLAGSAGYAVMQARTSHAAHVIVQDSIARVRVDSVAKAEAAEAEAAAADTTPASDSLAGEPLTPADSIRALVAERQQRDAAGATPDAPKAPAKAADAKAADAKAADAKTVDTKTPDAKTADAKPADPRSDIAPVLEAAALPANVLPERRLAKIFGNMAPRDAAKVLEQMSDADIRTILSMMGDRQAAAVLTALPAARAAAISKGAVKAAPEGATP